MRPFIGSLIQICSIILAALSVSAAENLPGLEGVPEIVAEVNGKPIPRNELLRELVGSSGAEALDRLVRRKLIEQAASAMKVAVSKEEIEQQFAVDKQELMAEAVHMPWDKKYKEFPIEELIQSRYKLSLADYKDLVIRQRLLVRRCVAQELKFTDQELLEFFNRYPALFQQPVKYHACHILISPLDPRDMNKSFRLRQPLGQMDLLRKKRIDMARDSKVNLEDAPSIDELDPAWRKARETAEKALREIKSGALTWDKALKQYTQDPLDRPWYDPESRRQMPPERETAGVKPGDVGWFHSRGPLVPEFYEGVKALKPGDLGGPVRTEYGYHLVKMLEIKTPPLVTFPECHEKARELYIENEIQLRTEAWLKDLVDHASLKTERGQLWPPRTPGRALPSNDTDLNPAPRGADKGGGSAEADPVVGSINEWPLRRSEVWRELLRSDGDEALDRLINLEVVMGMLKEMGIERLEWEAADPARRPLEPPPNQPIRVNPEALDVQLNDDRLRLDRQNEERLRAAGAATPELSFAAYIYQRYGQSVEEHKRSLEAGLVLREAVRRKIPLDDKTLQVQFALAREQYSQPAWYELSQILLVPTGGMSKGDNMARLQARQVAEQIYKRYVAEPGSFTQMVQDFSMDTPANKSRGGSLGACYPDGGEIPDGALIYAEIQKQKLERGQASTPFSTPQGFHIVRVDSVHPQRQADFEEAKARLERDYLQERAKMYTDIWLRALKAKAIVKRHLFQGLAEREEGLPPENFPLPK